MRDLQHHRSQRAITFTFADSHLSLKITALGGIAHPLQRLVAVLTNAITTEITQAQIIGSPRILFGLCLQCGQATLGFGISAGIGVESGGTARAIGTAGIVTNTDGAFRLCLRKYGRTKEGKKENQPHGTTPKTPGHCQPRKK